MKHGFFCFMALAGWVFFAVPAIVRADRNPDFEDDATPILRLQPQLLDYVHRHFDVKDTGAARFPGDDDHPPRPPFIFQARPRDSDGPFYIRLLVQPGPPGHILKIVDMRAVRLPPMGTAPRGFPPAGDGGPSGSMSGGPAVPPPGYSTAPNYSAYPSGPMGSVGAGSVTVGPDSPAPQPAAPPQPAPAPAASPAPQQNTPTSDTPSGPIMDSGAPSSAATPDLTPPPDPAPVR